MAVFSKDAVAAALDQLAQTLDEAKGGGKENTEEEKEEGGSMENGVHAPPICIPLVLEQHLERIAKTGNALLPWVKLKPLIILKLEKVIEHVTNEEEDLSFLDEKIQVSASDGSPLSGGDGDPSSIHILKMKKRIVSALNNFQGIPFTIQRLCELLTQPKTYYKRIDKLLRGLEKNVRIVRTISPLLPAPPPPPPPKPINASLLASSPAGEALNNSDSFVIKATASTSSSSSSTSSSPLSNLEKQEVNLPASSSSSSFSASALDPSQFATHSTTKVHSVSKFESKFLNGRQSLLDADADVTNDVEMTTTTSDQQENDDDEKMDDAESPDGDAAVSRADDDDDNDDAVSTNASLNENEEMVDQLTAKFTEDVAGEKGLQERVTVQQLNSQQHEVTDIRGLDLADAKEEEMRSESARQSSFDEEGEELQNEEVESSKEVEDKKDSRIVGEEEDEERKEKSEVDFFLSGENIPASGVEGVISGPVSSDSLEEEVKQTELTSTTTELSSPMKRKRSVGASGNGEEEEEEPPLKRNSPDIEDGLGETKGEGGENRGTEPKAEEDSAVEQKTELAAA